MFSRRTNWTLTANELTRRLDEHRRSGHRLWDLTESNPTCCGFVYPPELLSALTDAANTVYRPAPKGLVEAREAITQYYEQKGVSVGVGQILLTASTSEAYSFLFRLMVNPGERVLVPRPSYPLLDFLAEVNDVQLDSYPLVYDNGWRIDTSRLEEAIRRDTRALVVVNPNNPTGSAITQAEQEILEGLCRRHEIALISDEVFSDYLYSPAERGPVQDAGVGCEKNRRALVPTLAGTSAVLTFVVNGVSKVLGLPQMKLAWIVVNGPSHLREEAAARLEVIADTYLSVSTPVQRALPRWMAFRPLLRDQILRRVITNRQFLQEAVAPLPDCRLLAADGGWYAVLHLPTIEDEETFVLDLLDREGVLVHPGYFFDFLESGYIVLSLLPLPETFRYGVERLLACLPMS